MPTTQMSRAEADAHRAQLLAKATSTSGPEGLAAWAQLRDFNTSRRVAAAHGLLCDRQRDSLSYLQAV